MYPSTHYSWFRNFFRDSYLYKLYSVKKTYIPCKCIAECNAPFGTYNEYLPQDPTLPCIPGKEHLKQKVSETLVANVRQKQHGLLWAPWHQKTPKKNKQLRLGQQSLPVRFHQHEPAHTKLNLHSAEWTHMTRCNIGIVGHPMIYTFKPYLTQHVHHCSDFLHIFNSFAELLCKIFDASIEFLQQSI